MKVTDGIGGLDMLFDVIDYIPRKCIEKLELGDPIGLWHYAESSNNQAVRRSCFDTYQVLKERRLLQYYPYVYGCRYTI
jgi:hypothetical protein